VLAGVLEEDQGPIEKQKCEMRRERGEKILRNSVGGRNKLGNTLKRMVCQRV